MANRAFPARSIPQDNTGRPAAPGAHAGRAADGALNRGAGLPLSRYERPRLVPAKTVMTAVSVLTASIVTPLAVRAASPAPAPALPVESQEGVRVALASSSAASPVYAAPSPLPSAETAVWENSAEDAISALMTGNYGSASAAGRFKGLGAALLERFREEKTGYSQSLLQARPGSLSAAAQRAELHRETDNQVTLTVRTASGKEVRIKLGSGPEGLAVSVDIADDAELSQAERDALADLSQGFQEAIDGLAAGTGAKKLSGLLAFDSTVLSSVDLQAAIRQDGVAQSLSLSADGRHRSLRMTSATGTIQVDVDLSQEAILGKASQRDAAVRDYLRQFDRARQRGEGDAALMTQFKDAFSAMHSQYGNEAPPDLLSREITLSRGDRSALSGMADFSASISQVSQSPNAILPEERDSFRFAVSQRTQVGGANTPNRSLRQEQQASLSASYHRQIDAETPMNLAGPRETQNYLYIEIQDRSSSTTDIAYRDGALIKAQVKTLVNESTKTSRFINGQQTDSSVVPSESTQTKSLRSLLRATDRAAQADASHLLREHVPLMIESGYDRLAGTAAKARRR
ncbi:hypothetical protein L539_1339 [Bordetella hinzii 5132]|uniref:N-acetyltransferase YedL n=3 Tax=Bordetella hinzii TaxID=103855 RepID=A0ABR4R0A8_9BORD|nr:hypothetical protein L544_3733 [Bordetella hinzii OH87 BAL007II]KCB43103.1 hypothetical protein L539_1339 [Bordetella hinzii 5132]